MFVNQTGNRTEGDVVAGNKIQNVVTLSIPNTIEELHVLYEKLKSDGVGEASDGTFCEQLEHYLSVKTDGDVRGLEQKLEVSGRLDQLDTARDLKERAVKGIMKRQTSRTAQRIYTVVLDEIHTAFDLTVTPAVQGDADRQQVDQLVHNALQTLRSALGENLLELSIRDLHGLLYFLAGNCHIRWDKC